jgi:hypothetical protein
MKEIQGGAYGGWTSYTYTKYNDETSCNCFRLGELVGAI